MAISPEPNAEKVMETNITQNWLGIAALLIGIGGLLYGVMHGRAEQNTDAQTEYTEKLERISRETVDALRSMTDEMRRQREDMMALHMDNQENAREIRDAIRGIHR
jgi:uncharacterized protein HemX